MSTWWWGRIIWYGGFVATVFMALELTGLYHVAPWPTFSATVQHDVQHHPWFAVLALGICMGITVHWLFGQKLWPSVFFGFSVALSAHFLNNKWP